MHMFHLIRINMDSYMKTLVQFYLSNVMHVVEETPDDAGSSNKRQVEILRGDREHSRTPALELGRDNTKKD